MSHAQRGDVTHTRVTPFKIAWLILDTERCGGTDQIGMVTDVHVNVSHVKKFGVTLIKNHTIYTGVTEKR
jgi:hypothetical protein